MWKDPRVNKIYKTRPQSKFLKSGLAVKFLVPYSEENSIIESIKPYSEPNSLMQVMKEVKLMKGYKKQRRQRKSVKKTEND